MSNEVKQKARAELLDQFTGKSITEVDILTSSETIFYTNPDPLLEDVGDLKAGQTFSKYRLDKILDNLLYKYAKPTISVLSTNNTDFPNIVYHDTTVIKPKHTTIDEFTVGGTIEAGSQKNITVYLKVLYDDSMVYTDSANITVEPGKIQIYGFTVPSITKGATIVFSVFDGIEMVEAPKMIYKFVDPVFVGFADPKLLDGNLELDITRMSEYYDYFIGLINNNSEFINKKYMEVPDSSVDIKAISTNITDRIELKNPFILVPSTWGDVSSIIDMNGFHILKMYTFLTGMNLKLYDDVNTTSYILCMSKTSVNTNSKFVEGITYRFHGDDPDISNTSGNGVPVISSFTMNASSPVDSRFVVKTYDELLSNIQFPYNGLITYVEDINTHFAYNNGNWLPTSTKVVLIEDNSALTSDFCGWDDVAINSKTGQVYRKRYNNVWELWGVLGDGLDRGMSWKGTYNPTVSYEYNDVVYYNNTTYVCNSSTPIMGATPTGDGNWDIMCKGYNGPDIQYMDTDTGEIL